MGVTPDQSLIRNNCIEEVLNTPKIFRTGASPSHEFYFHIRNTLFVVLTFSKVSVFLNPLTVVQTWSLNAVRCHIQDTCFSGEAYAAAEEIVGVF